MHESQRPQFTNLPLVDRGLENKIELIEGLHVRQVSELESGLEVSLAARIGFRTDDLQYEVLRGSWASPEWQLIDERVGLIKSERYCIRPDTVSLNLHI